ncbi:hypothetical protein ANTRET_LOCUS3669 [Anthophora retusa]
MIIIVVVIDNSSGRSSSSSSSSSTSSSNSNSISNIRGRCLPKFVGVCCSRFLPSLPFYLRYRRGAVATRQRISHPAVSLRTETLTAIIDETSRQSDSTPRFHRRE